VAGSHCCRDGLRPPATAGSAQSMAKKVKAALAERRHARGLHVRTGHRCAAACRHDARRSPSHMREFEAGGRWDCSRHARTRTSRASKLSPSSSEILKAMVSPGATEVAIGDSRWIFNMAVARRQGVKGIGIRRDAEPKRVRRDAILPRLRGRWRGRRRGRGESWRGNKRKDRSGRTTLPHPTSLTLGHPLPEDGEGLSRPFWLR